MSATIAEAEPASNCMLTRLVRAYELLGGEQILKTAVTGALDAHDLIVRGIPERALLHLVDGVAVLSKDDVLKETIGISVRTLRRRKTGSKETVLSIEQGDRAWRIAELIARATDALGSQQAAESWLLEPAIGLGNRKPIDLVCTAVGARALRSFMTQVEYGVYI